MAYGKPFKMPSAYDPTPPCEYVTEVRLNEEREKDGGVMSEPKPMPNYWALAEEVTHLHGKLDKLQVENAKLRELVQSFHSAMLCTLDTGMWPTDPKWLEERMEELGAVS